ncbi:ABC transporter transmembrane domain-containing protein [Traorella massiliensis]|nr:ABC transporter transmembrane domain-containing protein [Traorella massiliensis]
MKLMTQFIKPYRKLLIFTILLIFLDVIGALYIPTLVAEMLNQGTSGSTMNNLYMTGIQIVIASLVSGVGAILGGYTCAVLSSKVCKDIRDALYQKSLKLSVYDFKQFGTASITTRTISDV